MTIDCIELCKQELKLIPYYYLLLIRNNKMDELEKLILHEEEPEDNEMKSSIIQTSNVINELQAMDYIKLMPDDTIELREKALRLWRSEESIVREVINYLNITCKKKFGNVESNNKFIRSRIHEGYGLEDFKKAIDNALKDDWYVKNPKFLRPETIFNGSKFQTHVQDNNVFNGGEQISNYEMI